MAVGIWSLGCQLYDVVLLVRYRGDLWIKKFGTGVELARVSNSRVLEDTYGPRIRDMPDAPLERSADMQLFLRTHLQVVPLSSYMVVRIRL